MATNTKILSKRVEIVDIQPGQEGSLLDISSETDSLTNTNKHLGYLNDVQEVIVRQQRNMRETLRGTEEPNVYFLYDRTSGEKLFHIQENIGCCQQQCFGGSRKFQILIYDKFNREVIELKRSTSCSDCFFCLSRCCNCLDKVTVYVKNYKKLPFEWVKVGQVKQNWNFIFPSFNVCDVSGEKKYKLKGPIVTSGCFSNIIFKIQDPLGNSTVGNITKEWSGLCTEYTSNADLFTIKFPDGNIDEKIKATLLGAMIFIDFKYFEG